MENLKVGIVLEDAWELTKKHGLMLSLMLIVIYIIYGALSALLGGASDYTELQQAMESQDWQTFGEIYSREAPANAVTTLVIWILTSAFLNTCLCLANGKKSKVDFSGFQMPVMTYIKLIGASIVSSAIVGLGFVCCILPGIFLAVRLMFINVCIMDDPELPFFDAFKKSWDITSGNFWSLLLLGIVTCVIVLIGVCICCIGSIPAIVIVSFAEVIAYLYLLGKTPVIYGSEQNQ